MSKEIYNINNVISQTNSIMNFDYFSTTLHLTDGCNYKCSYCYGQEPIGKDNFISIDTIKSVLKQVFELNKKYYNICILGGEVTYIPNFIDIIDYISSSGKNVRIEILTNGSRNFEYFKNLLSYKNVFITISIHLEYMDDKSFKNIQEIIRLNNEYGYYNNTIYMMPQPVMKDKFIKYTDILLDYRKKYNFNLLFTEIVSPPAFNTLDPRYDQDYLNLIQDFRNKFAKIVSEYGIINHPNVDVVQSVIKFPEVFYNIKDNSGNKKHLYIGKDIDSAEALSVGLKDFKGFYCIGNNYLNITPNGDYYSTECQLIKIGNIYDGPIDFIKLSKPMECTRDKCGCRGDVLSSKFRDKNEANNFFYKYIGNLIPKFILEMINSMDSNEVVKFIDINNDKVKDLINSMSTFELFRIINIINSNNILNNNNIINSSNSDYNGDKITKLVNSIAWWIPVKKWRNNFRNKILYGQEQSRAEQSRAEQSRAVICKEYIHYNYIINDIIINNKLQSMHQNTFVA
ncbi:radical SAM protein [Brachyspira intermedia]|uniref:radical SAM protein n=1 Tax=Brachyspira intermedia TaxID=84377 RepID=UPI003006EAE7